MKYEHRNYGMSIKLILDPSPVIVTIYPKWWRCFFLREKPKTYTVDDVCKNLGQAARKTFEEQVTQLFENGKKD